MTELIVPRRSALFMPGANLRAMDKARVLACDVVIFDLEDAVSVNAKEIARQQVVAQTSKGGYARRELIIRCNGIETPWFQDDVRLCAAVDNVDGLLFPKIETEEDVRRIRSEVDAINPGLPIWIMVETPRGVLNASSLAQLDVDVLVMGTSDLIKETRGRHTSDRRGLIYALSHCVLSARACGKIVLDGVHLEFQNLKDFEEICRQGRDLGFDGKTLIHPSQITLANDIFGIESSDIQNAEKVVSAWSDAKAKGEGVAVLDGTLVENLHYVEAQRVLAFAKALKTDC